MKSSEFYQKGPGIRIQKTGSETIKVVEGNGTARVIGTLILLGGTMLTWHSFDKIMDLGFIFGIILLLFGAAIATQRYVMILDRLHGTWSYGGDVFFVIPFKSSGSLTTLGPIRITEVANNPREDNMGKIIFTHAVAIEARNINGGREELRFGKCWSLQEAKELAGILSGFLKKPIVDETNSA